MVCPNCGGELAADFSCARCAHFAPPPDPAANRGRWAKIAGRLAPVGVLAWKFKAILVIGLTKGKLLLLGLTKMSTLLSMLATFGVYWSMYGWRFAAGLVLSIYIHEMGHVFALRRHGIPANAPMFIPGFGAFVRMKAYPASASEDARVGLAGPIYGLGAAVFAWIMGLLTGAPVWLAIARIGAWINLFNLIPIWQLDGGRGFRALTHHQRGLASLTALAMWIFTEEVMLLIICLAGAFRLFGRDHPEQPDYVVLVQYVGLLVFLSMLIRLI